MKTLSAVRLTLCLIASLLLTSGTASAHRTSLGGIAIEAKGDIVAIVLTLSAHDLAVAARLPTGFTPDVQRSIYVSGADAIRAYVAGRLTVGDGNTPCPLQRQNIAIDPSDPPETIVVTSVVRCPQSIRRLMVDYSLLFDIDDRHRVLGTLTVDGRATDIVLDAVSRRVQTTLDATDSGPVQRFGQIFLLGVEHILLGFDHLLFLTALLIGVRRAGTMVAIVTAFTLAHSLTLGLAWYGLVDPPQRLVEFLIAASIAVVAAGNLTGIGRRRGWLLAGGFGLIHGLGFFAVLETLGLDREHAALTLLGFNLGVEAGQLAIAAAAWLPLHWWARQSWHPRTAMAASTAILLVAGWWMLERAFIA